MWANKIKQYSIIINLLVPLFVCLFECRNSSATFWIMYTLFSSSPPNPLALPSSSISSLPSSSQCTFSCCCCCLCYFLDIHQSQSFMNVQTNKHRIINPSHCSHSSPLLICSLFRLSSSHESTGKIAVECTNNDIIHVKWRRIFKDTNDPEN